MRLLILANLFLIIIFSKISKANILISEIMPNPIADENLNEWVEIFNNGTENINVNGWIIGDEKNNDTIEGPFFNKEGAILPPFGYAIITSDATRVYNNFNVSQQSVRLYVDSNTIGNGLSNDGETIFLYDENKNLIDYLNYGKLPEGMSFALFNDTFIISENTLGYGNLNSNTQCDYEIKFKLTEEVFNDSELFNFSVIAEKIKGDGTNLSVKVIINNLFEEQIKEYTPWTNDSIHTRLTSSTYKPELKEGQFYELIANLSVACTDSNIDNNLNKKIIKILGNNPVKESKVEIKSLKDLGSDNEAKFGQVISVEAIIYKGDTNKYSISAWIEDDKGKKVSKNSKVNVFEKFTEYTFTIPVQINPNCNERFKNDKYNVVLSGLDSQSTKKIEISGLDNSICNTLTSSDKGNNANRVSFDYKIVEIPNVIKNGKKFDIVLRLDNNGDESMQIAAWSYVYRGKKHYSKDDNKKKFILQPHSSDLILLKNLVENAESGNYKVKVFINKNRQKTNLEIVNDIVLKTENSMNRLTLNNQIKNNYSMDNDDNNAKKSGNTKIEAWKSNESNENIAFFGLLLVSVFLNVILIWKR